MPFAKAVHKDPFLAAFGDAEILALVAIASCDDCLGRRRPAPVVGEVFPLAARHILQIRLQLGLEPRNLLGGRRPKRPFTVNEKSNVWSWKSALAGRAIERRPATLDVPPHGAPETPPYARFAFATVDGELVLD